MFITIEMLERRKALLMERDPVANANIVRKIDRRIRALSKKS